MTDSNYSFRENRLLAALSEEEYQQLVPHFSLVFLSRGQLLYEWGEPIVFSYFPLEAMISIVATDEQGKTCEVGMVGREGVSGLPVILGGHSTINRAVVQIPGPAVKINAEILKREFEQAGNLQKILLLYCQAFLSQVTQTVFCNSQHYIEARLARWLLLAQDYAQVNELPLTQEYLALMLGVRRSSISEIASALGKEGMIRYSRGKILIVDRNALETKACGCYRLIKGEYQRLIGA
ncbi:MAG: Crp/Fnr family transcriptional regulator [Cyanophyceae cyanobacterium]